ncbi:MAG: carboxypeptidase regulatory-like domain-containing protein [Planctomycetota bacterium]
MEVYLEPELTWKGVVVDAESRPIEGANVRLDFLSSDAAELRESSVPSFIKSADAQTGSEGNFEIRRLSRGIYRATIEAPSYATSTLPIVNLPPVADDGKRVTIVLATGVDFEGRVLSENGQPIESARVRAFYLRDDEYVDGSRSTDTDDRGSFSFPALRDGMYWIEAVADFHRGEKVRVSASDRSVELRLQELSPIEAVVVDAQTQEPIAGAEICWESEERESESGVKPWKGTIRSDESGEFRLVHFPVVYPLVARIDAAGYESGEVDLTDESTTQKIRIELDPSGSISGVVSGPSGASVAGLRVTVFDSGGELSPGATTEDDGSFHIEFSEPGQFRVRASGGVFVPAFSEPFEFPESTSLVDGIAVRVELAAEISGTVTSSDGVRVPGARIQVAWYRDQEFLADLPKDWQPPTTPNEETRSDGTGSFSISRLAEDTYRATVSAAGYVPIRSDPFTVGRGSKQTLNFVLSPERSLSGIVVDADSEPIEEALVYARLTGDHDLDPWTSGRAVTDHQGRFRIPRLGDGEYDLVAQAEGFADGEALRVSSGSRGVEIQLDRLVSVSGRVIGWHSKEPITSFALHLRDPEDEPPQDPFAPKSDSTDEEDVEVDFSEWERFRDDEGRFVLSDIAPGEYLLDVTAKSCFPGDPIELEVLVDVGAQDVEIELRERGVLSGVVLDGRALPIAGVEVSPYRRWEKSDGRRGLSQVYGQRTREDVQAGRGPPRLSVQTGDDGRFVITGLEDAEYRLDFQHEEFERKDIGDFVIVHGEGGDSALAISTSLSWGVTLRGRVWGLKEIEGQRAKMKLRPLKVETAGEIEHRSRSKSLEVTGLGEFEFPALSAGSYLLYLEYRRPNEERAKTRRELVRIFDEGREKVIRLDLSKRASRRDR